MILDAPHLNSECPLDPALLVLNVSHTRVCVLNHKLQACARQPSLGASMRRLMRTSCDTLCNNSAQDPTNRFRRDRSKAPAIGKKGHRLQE